MVKILAIGDFHGKIPKKLFNRIKKEKFDLIISPGDFCGSKELGKLFFKYAYGSDKELYEFIGKRKFKELERKNFESGISVLKKLNSFNIPVICVKGNWDPIEFGEIGYPNQREVELARKFNNIVLKFKNIKFIDFKNTKFNKINLVGYPRSSYPGFIDKKREESLRKRKGKLAIKIIKQTRLDNKKYYSKLKALFVKDSMNLFVSHNAPFKTFLDKVKKGPVKGKHYGSYLTKKIITDLKPKIVICGHMHESYGIQKIGKSIILNPGSAMDGRAAILNIDKEEKVIVKLIHS